MALARQKRAKGCMFYSQKPLVFNVELNVIRQDKAKLFARILDQVFLALGIFNHVLKTLFFVLKCLILLLQGSLFLGDLLKLLLLRKIERTCKNNAQHCKQYDEFRRDSQLPLLCHGGSFA